MAAPRAGDLTVVIPTRDRWPVLGQTLAALAAQTEKGFDVVIVCDGTDQVAPPAIGDADGVRVLHQEHAGPGAARNVGVRATDRSFVLLLGDDMLPRPDLVARHLDRHAREPSPLLAVLGRVVWHPEVADDRVMRWLEWSGAQFDYRQLESERRAGHAEAGFGRFYSCNVSLSRELFLGAGGFDPDFRFDYEDLDFGRRLHEHGMRLVYEPGAIAEHLHHHDWESVQRRYESRARAERLMMRKHAWFRPWFHDRTAAHAAARRVSPVWARVLDRVPERPARMRAFAERRADRWYHQQLAPRFMAAWEGERDLEELREYLGDRYEQGKLVGHRTLIDEEAAAAPDEASFYRTSELYLYDLTAFAMSGAKDPYRRQLQRVVAPGARVLDYGCGIGSDGLRLIETGYRVAFADYDNPSTAFLRWRLAHRGVDAEVHDLDRGVPGGFEAAYAFDVIEHVDDPFAFLSELERRAAIVAVNLLEPVPDDTPLHRDLPIGRLLVHAARRGLLVHRRYNDRSHLVIYRSGGGDGAVARARSLGELGFGRFLPG